MSCLRFSEILCMRLLRSFRVSCQGIHGESDCAALFGAAVHERLVQVQNKRARSEFVWDDFGGKAGRREAWRLAGSWRRRANCIRKNKNRIIKKVRSKW